MNLRALALGVAASGLLAAHAQTVIEERHDSPPPPSSSVTVVHPGVVGTERKSTTVETNGAGDCTTKTVHKENLAGSKTVKKTNCD